MNQAKIHPTWAVISKLFLSIVILIDDDLLEFYFKRFFAKLLEISRNDEETKYNFQVKTRRYT